MTVLLGIIYPFFMYMVGQLFFRKEANGSLIVKDGRAIGAYWIGQDFQGERYFHPRPSAAGDKGYDASNSSGSNLGPTSQKLIDALRKRAVDYRTQNKLDATALIPADAVTTSGSGLDPHISVSNALLQVPRIAAARGLSEENVIRLILEHTKRSTWGILGADHVHVLNLNLALDQAVPAKRAPVNQVSMDTL